MARVMALDVEAVDSPGQAKAGGCCAIVTQVDGGHGFANALSIASTEPVTS